MIEVTRINGSIFFVNPDLIVTLEETPDTVITLTNGEKFVVRETPQILIERFLEVKRKLSAFPQP
ncbi:MAG: flagellar FlbD family protein [Cyanobacteria bacterium]|nr:flagellar FlbD family protein [Cyanobacteriota bacterium]